jgi:predicted HAD superfamily hydrolase
LIKILGNEAQFHYWVEDFLIQDGFIEEKIDSSRSFYSKTVSGELFHHLLKNGNVMQALLRISGKKLRRY